MAYVFRGRDRRLLAQSARDLALCLQRDYRTFNDAKTTQLSTRTTFFSGYTGTWPNISYTDGSQVDMALQVLGQMVADLGSGSYGPSPNPDIVPPASVTWDEILAVYALVSVTTVRAAAARGVSLQAKRGAMLKRK